MKHLLLAISLLAVGCSSIPDGCSYTVITPTKTYEGITQRVCGNGCCALYRRGVHVAEVCGSFVVEYHCQPEAK